MGLIRVFQQAVTVRYTRRHVSLCRQVVINVLSSPPVATITTTTLIGSTTRVSDRAHQESASFWKS
jgi:hypothetical protein